MVLYLVLIKYELFENCEKAVLRFCNEMFCLDSGVLTMGVYGMWFAALEFYAWIQLSLDQVEVYLTSARS